MTKTADEHFLASVIEHLAHPVFVKDREFRYVFVNRALLEMIGRVGEDVIGKDDFELFAPAEASAFRIKDEEMFSTRKQVEIEEEFITDRLGRTHALATTKVPLASSSGEITHLVGIIHDITELKAAQEALRVANEELSRSIEARTAALETALRDLVRKERLAELGKLAGGVAHEIRNPLAAIKNAAYVMDRNLRPDTPPEVRETLAIVHDEIRRANHIVSELLDYARVREPERRSVRLVDLISAAVKASDVPAGVAVMSDETDASVLVDAMQVEAALSNIIRNSVEAMHGRGEISFKTSLVDDHIEILVCDTGPGVASSVEGQLFEPLVTTKSSGLGLGLVTARTLVERQGGTLVYRSDSRPGACFEMSLPRVA